MLQRGEKRPKIRLAAPTAAAPFQVLLLLLLLLAQPLLPLLLDILLLSLKIERSSKLGACIKIGAFGVNILSNNMDEGDRDLCVILMIEV